MRADIFTAIFEAAGWRVLPRAHAELLFVSPDSMGDVVWADVADGKVTRAEAWRPGRGCTTDYYTTDPHLAAFRLSGAGLETERGRVWLEPLPDFLRVTLQWRPSWGVPWEGEGGSLAIRAFAGGPDLSVLLDWLEENHG